MWEIECYDWKTFNAYRDPSRVPHLLQVALSTDIEDEWSSALEYLESCGSDLGVPCEITPPLVSALTSIALRTSGRKRSDILSLLEELTCGRGVEEYSEEQKKWLRDAVNELVLVFKGLVDLMERSSAEDAQCCVDMLAYCAEHVPHLAGKVRKYLELCQQRYPQLTEEIRSVTEYFRSNLTG